MKNLAKFFVAVVALFVGISCATDSTEDLTQQVVGDGQTTITVSTGDGELRTSLGKKVGDEYQVLWSKGDKLALNKNGVVTQSAAIATEFVGKTSADFTWEGEFEVPYLLTYPSSSAGTVTLDTTQDYVAGTFSASSVPMYAYVTTEGEVKLNYLAGVLRIGIYAEEETTINSMYIENLGDAPIAGEFTCSNEGVLTPAADDVVLNKITYNAKGVVLSQDSTDPTYFHISVLPGKYETLRLTILTDKGTMIAKVKAGEGREEIVAGQVREFKLVEFDPESGVYFEIKDEATLNEFAGVVEQESASAYDVVVVTENFEVKNWDTPIANFVGVFDGQGHTISGLQAPLFNKVSGTIKDINVSGTVTKAYDGCAGLLVCDLAKHAKVMNCTSAGSVTVTCAKGGSVGGLIGYADTTTTIEGASNSASVTVNGENAGALDIGGVVGGAWGTMANATNTGAVAYSGTNATGLRIGGVAGMADRGFTSVTNGTEKAENGTASEDGKVTVDGTFNFPTDGVFEFNVGGLAGRVGSHVSTSTNYGTVTISSALKAPNTSSYGAFAIGGCVGRGAVTYNTVKNAGALTVSSNIADASYATDMHPVMIAGVVAYAGDGNSKKLYNSGTITVSGTHSYTTSGLYVSGIYGRGSNGDSYTFQEFENTGTINVSTTMESTKPTVHIAGIASYQLKGTQKNSFNNAPISFTGSCANLYVAGVSADDDTNVVFNNCDNKENGKITIDGACGTAYNYIGGICCYVKGTKSMTDCENEATISYNNTTTDTSKLGARARIGGLVGLVESAELAVSKCSNSGDITVSQMIKYYGGCFGHINCAAIMTNWTNITNSGDITYPKGTPKEVTYIGGCAGNIQSATGEIKQWHNSGNISVGAGNTSRRNKRVFVGGIAGASSAKTLSYCSNTGNVIAPWYFYKASAAGVWDGWDLSSWVGLLIGNRYYNRGATGYDATGTTPTTPSPFTIKNCYIKGTIKRLNNSHTTIIDEVEVDDLDKMYKYACAEPGDVNSADEDPTKYFINCSATDPTVAQEPSTEE